MIISASRRTDICAYYSNWFFNRIEAGFCTVPNPFNSRQVSLVDLKPSAVEAIVFWTRNARPVLNGLQSLSSKNYQFYFQYTINNYPSKFDPSTPKMESSIAIFKSLVNMIGVGKVIWRYDPILITSEMNFEYHIKNFNLIAKQLKGYTNRVVISLVDDYKKTLRRVLAIDETYHKDLEHNKNIKNFLTTLVGIAEDNGFEIQSCAEKINYSDIGIVPGKCIDDNVLRDELGIDLNLKKDKSQRKECGCITSKDIGMNNTCLMGCEYCYATISQKAAISNFEKHNPDSPSLIGWYDIKEINEQMDLF